MCEETKEDGYPASHRGRFPQCFFRHLLAVLYELLKKLRGGLLFIDKEARRECSTAIDQIHLTRSNMNAGTINLGSEHK